MRYQDRETLIMEGADWTPLRYDTLLPGSLTLSAHDREGAPLPPFKEGEDYEADYARGRVRRLPSSRIGDWRDSLFHGLDPFDHTLYPAFGNYDYMVYASYLTGDGRAGPPEIAKARQLALSGPGLTSLAGKIVRGERVRYCVYGDSISTGGEAVPAADAYFHRFARLLEQLGAVVEVINRSIGGEASPGGLARLQSDVLPLKADLVTIAYGMNDQNRARGADGEPEGGPGAPHAVEPDAYARNIRAMAVPLLKAGSEVILITPCLPNPRWKHTSGDAELYRQALLTLGAELSIPVADVLHGWQSELDAGKRPSDLLLNDINHPTSYGHFLYFCALAALL